MSVEARRRELLELILAVSFRRGKVDTGERQTRAISTSICARR